MNEHTLNIELLTASKSVVSNAICRDSIRGRFEDSVFNNILCEFDRELERLLRSLRDLTLVSLHVRNIFELYLICLHILSSKDAFESWMGQMHKDAIDIHGGLVELLELHGHDATEIKEIIESSNKALEESVFESSRGFNIKELADKYNCSADYSAVYKICSKLLHPTSIKINAFEAFIEDENYLKSLIHVAVFFCKKFEDLCREIVVRRSS